MPHKSGYKAGVHKTMGCQNHEGLEEGCSEIWSSISILQMGSLKLSEGKLPWAIHTGPELGDLLRSCILHYS